MADELQPGLHDHKVDGLHDQKVDVRPIAHRCRPSMPARRRSKTERHNDSYYSISI